MTGKRRQTRVSARTVNELTKIYTATLHQVQTDDYIEPTTATLAEYLRSWLDAVKPTIRPSSYDRYTRIVNGQVIPALGAVKLSKLTPLHVQDWYGGLLVGADEQTALPNDGGPLSRRAAYSIDQAVKWRLIARNVCGAVDAPQPKHPEMRTWAAEQAKTFLAATAEDSLSVLWYPALYIGMQRVCSAAKCLPCVGQTWTLNAVRSQCARP